MQPVGMEGGLTGLPWQRTAWVDNHRNSLGGVETMDLAPLRAKPVSGWWDIAGDQHLTPEQRADIARVAADACWKKSRESAP